ncbi:hypothetical protein [Aurantiacibacter zhengii]|uniref:Sulfotransferase family protein n=1 Tax=Aurantiacibacter zhengii TaxID=2307003 RepID=A0A418NRG4_9SPHN|nr:hypothetical protein [Aurantiacibacter zhengii]RIV85638.1 hypothetical protein D2V07_09835 [Aurantiacibacter zhengii]
MDWRPGFFQLGLPVEAPVAAIQPLDAWCDQVALPTEFADTSAIFHVSRCGSTLLTQNMKATGEVVVLSEPPFMRIMRTLLDDTLDEDMAIGIVARTIGSWQDWARSINRKLVIKFNSQAHSYSEKLMQALPGARFLFLHREPAPVLESIERHPPSYLLRGGDEDRYAPEPEQEGMTAPSLMHAAVSRYCTALRAFAEVTDADLLKIAYCDLARRWPEILRHCGLRGEGQPWNALIDAKARNPEAAAPYRPVEPEKVSSFAARHRELLELAQMTYTKFLMSGEGSARHGMGNA